MPIEHCYWVVPGRLLAGEYPRNYDDASSPAKVAALLAAGVTLFVDLTHDYDGLKPYSQWIGTAAHRRFPILDCSVPDSPQQTAAILDAIDRHIEHGQVAYVHCWGGIGRTGVIVGCWLARHGRGGKAALAELKKLWRACAKSSERASPETLEQEHYILSWEAGR